MPTKKPTTKTQWKKTVGGTELEVPSGNVALVRRLGLQVFVKKGVIPNSLMPMVNKAISSGEFDVKDELEGLNEQMLEDIIALYDAILLECVVEPHVSPVPLLSQVHVDAGLCGPDDIGNPVPYALRDQEELYVDEVDFQDKVFIFQWVVGGTRDVESFRAEQDAAMDALRSSGEVVAPAVSAPGDQG
jgi:hypothetical protein